MSDITIYAKANGLQTGVVIQDRTDWTSLGDSISSLSNIIVSLYQGNASALVSSYALSAEEETEYITNGEVTLLFTDIVGSEFIEDDWWMVQMTSNSGGYISNFSEFGIYADITHAVFQEINNVKTPENIKYNAEKYCTYAMFLEGLKYLDNSNINTRGVKFVQRLLALQKMLLMQ